MLETLIAVAPLAIYLVLLGWVNLRHQPYVLTGARESMLTGLALSGLAVIGPMELFFPQQFANQFGLYAWLLLFTFYGLMLTLWILVARPRLVIYNVGSDQLRAVLSEAASKLDPEARWAGDCLAMPRLNVQLHVESFHFMRNVALVSAGNEPNYTNWRRFEGFLRGSLQDIQVPRNPRGYFFAFVGAMLLTGLTLNAALNPHALAQDLIQLLRI